MVSRTKKPSSLRAFSINTACDLLNGDPASGAKILRREIPVHDVPVSLDELRTRIAIVDVIRMLPHIDGHERLRVRRERRGGVARRHDIHRAVRLLHEPGPARAERAG